MKSGVRARQDMLARLCECFTLARADTTAALTSCLRHLSRWGKTGIRERCGCQVRAKTSRWALSPISGTDTPIDLSPFLQTVSDLAEPQAIIATALFIEH